ncbi:DNA gyrase inhibitor YacG [Ferrovibrio sp.]|uniref:DNA gyrase inhibitor YacG n=1 Tax=Ferrovibrio sp. TaxID=1917215 RepID=UPI003516D206
MTGKACPICGKPAVQKHTPFCSPRCADVDLNRWLKEAYTIPAVELDDPDMDENLPEGGQADGPAGRLH